MFRIFLINIVLIFSLTACQVTPPKPVSKEIKWEADTDLVADAKDENFQENSAKSENSEEVSAGKAIEKATPNPTNPPQNTPSKTPKPTATPKAVKPSIRYAGMTVYVTKSGKKFHREDCSALAKSKIPMLFEEACAKNYTPCGICKP